MAIEPAENAIEAVADVTSLTRDAAIRWLKANDNDPGKAINAYFENPNALAAESQVNNTWDEEPFHSDKTDYAFQAGNQTSFTVHPQDSLGPSIFNSAPSRPPSRISNRGLIDLTPEHAAADPSKSLSAAEREEQSFQQAVAMSLDQTLPGQANGVTAPSNPYFGPASQDHYEANKWALTHSGQTTHEIILNPEPENRKRQDNTPAFIKPSSLGMYLPPLITILHAIPLAREALLLRDYTLPEYGHQAEWWDGVAVNVPRVVNISDDIQDSEGEEVIYETQRLMAFLDMTDRAYGSADVLANTRSVMEQGPEQATANFLKAWQEAAIRAAPHNGATNIFQSSGLKETPGVPEAAHRVPFHNLVVEVDLELADRGATLYDAIDEVLWPAPYDEEDTEETYLDTIGEVFTVRVIRQGSSGAGLSVKVPAVWYPDRYLESCKGLVKEMRAKKASIMRDIDKIERVQASIEGYKATDIEPATNALKLLETAIARLEKATPAHEVNGANGDGNDIMMEPKSKKLDQGDVAQQLRIIAERVEKKLESLNERREEARDQLRHLSKLITKPSENPEEPPYNKYTLRGVSTEPHITYVLKQVETDEIDTTPDIEGAGWQWWRISYSPADAKIISTTASPSASSPPAPEQGYELDSWGVPKGSMSDWARKARKERGRNADRAGFSVQKVREVEVLKAARDESPSALLVYASERAVGHEGGELPPQLKNFVRLDNLAFAAELGTPDSNSPGSPQQLTSPAKRKADDDDANNDDISWGGGGLPSTSLETANPSSTAPTNLPRYVPPLPAAAAPPYYSATRQGFGAEKEKEKGKGLSYDERIPSSLQVEREGSLMLDETRAGTGTGEGETDSDDVMDLQGQGQGQEVEMQERGGGALGLGMVPRSVVGRGHGRGRGQRDERVDERREQGGTAMEDVEM